MTIDLDELSPEEIDHLEFQLIQYRKSEKALRGHKVTFCFFYNPNWQGESIYADTLEDPESLAEELMGSIAYELEQKFNLSSPEGVYNFEVVPLTSSEITKLRKPNEN
jgi:hypothetical protein